MGGSKSSHRAAAPRVEVRRYHPDQRGEALLGVAELGEVPASDHVRTVVPVGRYGCAGGED